ncbi:MAG: EAL domain-containing protein [Phycisphaeraceae bacterium]|nr:EAL domain-containing protein [Phycisphaeraceae bacterium]
MDCNLGQVVDLSASGIRVLTRKRLTGEHTVVIKGLDQQALRLRVRVIWHRQHAALEHIHGMCFERLTSEQRDQLEDLVMALSAGRRAPKQAGFAGFGMLGLLMIAAAGVMLGAALFWGLLNEPIQAQLPGLYNSLNTVPELGALLVIAAGGFGLLGIAQRSASEHTWVDTQRRHRAQIELDEVRQSQNILNGILESSLGGVCVLDALRNEAGDCTGLQIQLINPAGEQLIGKGETELVGKMLKEALPQLTHHELYRDLLSVVNDDKPIQQNYQVGESGHWYLVAMVPLSDGIAVTFLDNTESQRKGQQLKHIAYHDELTGLPNRKALLEHVDSSLQRCRRTPGHNSAILFLDFDRFKNVNDTLGHEAGDQLLIGIAKRLNENLRDGDMFSTQAGACLPARLGGDEFVVLLDGIHTKEDALVVARRLLNVFKEPHLIAGQDVTSTASIGIAINHGEYDQAEDILRDADSALYIAKQNGKARYVLFDQNMQDQLIQRIRLEQDLQHALVRDELSLVYEPIIDLQTGTPVGFEALLRWTHPVHGEVSPTEFIPIAEGVNLIGEIGRWVIGQACQQLAEWNGIGLTGRFLNINLSRIQLYEADLVQHFEDQLKHHGLDAGSLQIELTETAVMNDLDFMADRLSQLKDLGLGLALDDFGTGYSSLSVLHKLPFDTLKIDRAFLDDARTAMQMDKTHRSSAIISTITQLADHLKLNVVAEGITAQEQIATLQTLSCQYAQGWLFSKPLHPEQATQMLQNPGCLASSLLDNEFGFGATA